MFPEPHAIRERNLQALAAKIEQTMELLDEYEQTRLYEVNPRIRLGAEREIDKLKKELAEIQQEYERLYQEAMSSRQSKQDEDVGAQLQALNSKMDSLLAEQKALMVGLNSAERAIITTVVEKLNQEQLLMSQSVRAAIEEQQIPQQELQEALSALQQALAAIHSRGGTLPHLEKEAAEQVTAILKEPTLDISHKLSVTLPLIPFLLSYEADIALQGEMNLKKAWDRLVSRVHRKP